MGTFLFIVLNVWLWYKQTNKHEHHIICLGEITDIHNAFCVCFPFWTMDQTMQKMIMTVPNFYIFPSWFLTAGWELNSMLLQEKSASFQTNQVERENHKPRPTSIQCSSIIFMHFFLLFAKLGGWNCKVSRISWLPSKLIATIHEPFFVFVPTQDFFSGGKKKSRLNELESLSFTIASEAS